MCVRFLAPTQYADLALIVSFFSLISICATTLSTATLGILSRPESKEDYYKLQTKILQLSLYIAGALSLISIFIFTPLLYIVIDINSPLTILIMLFAGILSIGTALITTHLQLEKVFIQNSYFGVVQTLLKLIFSMIFLILGYQIFGVAVALLLSGICSLILFYPKKTALGAHMLLVVSTDSSGISDFVSKYRKYFTGAFISALTLTLSFTIDTILAKSILTTDIASQYIGLATLAKLFLFTSLALSTIVFPYIIDPKHRDIQKRLTMYFLLFILTAGVACFFNYSTI
jgi:O-antigen/teichoic acid export membrane protein